MLNPRHDKRVVARRLTLREVEPTPGDVLAELRALRQPNTPSSSQSEVLYARSVAVAIEEFAQRHMNVRGDLAWRAARGEPLSTVERATLHALDAVLDELEAPPPPLSPEAQGILRDVLGSDALRR